MERPPPYALHIPQPQERRQLSPCAGCRRGVYLPAGQSFCMPCAKHVASNWPRWSQSQPMDQPAYNVPNVQPFNPHFSYPVIYPSSGLTMIAPRPYIPAPWYTAASYFPAGPPYVDSSYLSPYVPPRDGRSRSPSVASTFVPPHPKTFDSNSVASTSARSSSPSRPGRVMRKVGKAVVAYIGRVVRRGAVGTVRLLVPARRRQVQ